MARVTPVQSSEVRSNPQPNQQAKSGDPFAMLLDTVSKGRVNSPEPRRKPEAPENTSRANAAEKPERPQPKMEAKQAPETAKDSGKTAKDACVPKEEKTSDNSGDAADANTNQQADNDANTAAAAVVETPVVAVEAEVSINLNLNAGSEAGEAPAADEGVAPVAGVSADFSTEAAAQAQQNTQQAATVPAANAEAVSDTQTEAPVVAAAVNAAAKPETKQETNAVASAETETAASADVSVNSNDDGVKKEQPVHAQKPVTSNHADVREAAIAEKGEQQAQVKTANTQEHVQVKEHFSVKAEQAPVQAQADNSAPRPQVNPPAIPVMPEPVRALAGSINPVNLRAANDGAANAVQANAGALGVEIASRAKDGVKRFDIRLDPPELGRVEVRMEVGNDGKTSTRLIVERPETLDLLQRDSRNLERALQSAGLQTDEGGLQFSLQDQGQQQLADANSDRGYDRRGDFFASEIDDAEQASPVMDRYAQSIIARGGVDIRI